MKIENRKINKNFKGSIYKYVEFKYIVIENRIPFHLNRKYYYWKTKKLASFDECMTYISHK